MDPRDVIRRIHRDGDSLAGLPAAVSSHFAGLAVHAPVDGEHPPESYPHGSLVRFRAMIQDTSESEVYLARFSDGGCGGWGIQPEPGCDLDAVDPGCLGTASVFWAVSVPGESPWRAAEYPGPVHPATPARHHPTRPHKFPVPRAPHIGVRVKIYDNTNVDSLHSTDVVTFVGLSSSESLSIEDDASPQVPVLHVLCYHVATPAPTPTVDPSVRSDLIDWISREALGGDNDAAEWILLQLASKVHARAVPLLPPSLTLSRFPQPPSPELLPTLSHVLAELLPQYLPIPLSLDLLNTIPFLPESREEDLHSGHLQLPPGTTVLLTESAVQEGKLLEKGIINIRAIQDVMNSQTVDYIFPFSSKFTFHTDLPMIVVTEGRKSAFFQTSINLPLRCGPTTLGLYKPKDQVSLPSAETMAGYRSYVAACKAASNRVQVSGETSKHIQDDFVRRRQQDKSVTLDELVHLMKVARLLAASRLENEVTTEVWEQVKELDGRRQARQRNVG